MDFESPLDAQKAVQALQSQGVIVQFARLPTVSPAHELFINPCTPAWCIVSTLNFVRFLWWILVSHF